MNAPRGPRTAESIWLAELAKIPRIDAETEREYVRSGRRDLLVHAFLPLAFSCARKLAAHGSVEDLTQQANIGLIEAANRFEPDMGFRFQTFARYWIKASTHRYLSNAGRLIRLPAHIETAAAAFRKGKVTSHEDLLNMKLGMRESNARAVFFMLTSRTVTTEADEEAGTTGFTLVSSAPSPEEAVGDDQELQAVRARVNRALGHLTARERIVVEHRMMGDEVRDVETLAQIGERFGLSRERVRQVEVIAARKLRRLLELPEVPEPPPPPALVPRRGTGPRSKRSTKQPALAAE